LLCFIKIEDYSALSLYRSKGDISWSLVSPLGALEARGDRENNGDYLFSVFDIFKNQQNIISRC